MSGIPSFEIFRMWVGQRIFVYQFRFILFLDGPNSQETHTKSTARDVAQAFFVWFFFHHHENIYWPFEPEHRGNLNQICQMLIPSFEMLHLYLECQECPL